MPSHDSISQYKPSSRMIGLIDCNSFYCSCERVFRPELRNRPIGVLSNNDGCIVSLSPELKAMGIPIGTPYHLHRDELARRNVLLFSSNYELYGDLSARVMSVLRQFSDQVEIYSIDEAFIDLSHYPRSQLEAIGRSIQKTIYQWTGIPVGVGIAETKTLAKLANKLAKQRDGVCILTNKQERETLFHQLPVKDIWGIRYRLANRLIEGNIETVWQFMSADDAWILKHFSAPVLMTSLELKGISCLPLSQAPRPKRGIMNTRSFGEYLSDLFPIKMAVTFHASRGGEELRAQKLCASAIMVCLWEAPAFTGGPTPHASWTLSLSTPTDYTPTLVKTALNALNQVWRENRRYKKAGVFLLDLIPEGVRQRGLFDELDDERSVRLMGAVDKLNTRYGQGTIHLAAEGFSSIWRMRRNLKSPDYTTSWNELPVVKY